MVAHGDAIRPSARCTIVAATNPRGTGKFDATSSLSINTTLASPLLSRFDLVLLLVDTQNEEWDRKVPPWRGVALTSSGLGGGSSVTAHQMH